MFPSKKWTDLTSQMSRPITKVETGHRLSPHQLKEKKEVKLKKIEQKGFPGGAVVKNPPANAGHTGSSPGPGRSHMPWSNWAHEPQLLSPLSRAHEPQLLSLCT